MSNDRQLDEVRTALAAAPESQWHLESQDDGRYRLHAGDPPRLVAQDMEAGVANIIFRLLPTVQPVVLELERARVRLDAALEYAPAEARDDIMELLAPPEPSPEAKEALQSLFEWLEPYRQRIDDDE